MALILVAHARRDTNLEQHPATNRFRRTQERNTHIICLCTYTQANVHISFTRLKAPRQINAPAPQTAPPASRWKSSRLEVRAQGACKEKRKPTARTGRKQKTGSASDFSFTCRFPKQSQTTWITSCSSPTRIQEFRKTFLWLSSSYP